MRDDVFIKCEECKRPVRVIRDIPEEKYIMHIGQAYCQRCKRLYSKKEVEEMKKYGRERRL